MAARSLLGIAIFYLATFDAVMATFEYTFEFGERKGGSHEYHKDGSMFLFQYSTHINVHVPSNMRVSYVKVTVYAINSPSVNFNEHTNIVTISYWWYQITMSSYSLVALAVLD
ncbi:uncharacterized protein [Choristoneura fumiferana]|uniref:uncharacterized protein n=1 Tax=Choristoneura fumiferana TaxID=7141 RepID=UPI003D15D20F